MGQQAIAVQLGAQTESIGQQNNNREIPETRSQACLSSYQGGQRYEVKRRGG